MHIEDKQPTAKGPAEWFTGDVYIDPIATRKPEPSRMMVSAVKFTPGARTAWHSHAVGQTLHITRGIALIGTRDGTVVVARPGDTVYASPGEEHWHGATPTDFMEHLAMFEGIADGADASWAEHVSQDEYDRAAGRAADQS